MAEPRLALVKALYDYAASSDDEITIKEDQLYFLLDNSDADWSKIRLKADDDDAPSGLVPAAYIEEVEPISHAKAMYDYEATADGELSISEDQEVLVFEKEDDWWLVKATSPNGQLGLVPGNYLEEISSGESSSTTASPAPAVVPPEPARAYVDPSELVAASHDKVKPNDSIQTWAVSEIDSKGKKKKGTLGIGNGAMFFASEADKAPVQQWATPDVTVSESDKPKHIILEVGGSKSTTLHFNAGSKDVAEAILEKLHSSQQLARPSSPPAASPLPEAVPLPAEAPSKVVKQKKSVNFAAAPDVISASDHGDDDEEEEEGEGIKGTVLYDFTADGEDELSVAAGETVAIVDREGSEDWWKVQNSQGVQGVVPALYVEVQETGVSPSTSQSSVAQTRQAEERKQEAREQERQRTAEAEKKRQAEERAAREAREAEAAQRRRDAERRAAEQAKAQQAAQKPSAPSSSSRSVPSKSPRPESSSAPAKEKTRIWHDRTGQFRVEAEFLGMKDGKLRLHKINGVIIEVPMEKMSPADITYIQGVDKARKSTSTDEDSIPLARLPSANSRPSSMHSSAPAPTPPRPTPSRPKRPTVDWFEFFLNAGCDVDDCTRYASAFERDKIDESILADIEPSTLRTLGLREGDIIRVTKAIRAKSPDKSAETKAREAREKEAATQEQLRQDEELARKLQDQEGGAPSTQRSNTTSPAPNLFAGANGALKNPRRGRPTLPTKASSSLIDLPTITSASDQIRSSSPQVASPATMTSPPSTVSSAPTAAPPPERQPTSGFDDDAWAPRPSSTTGIKSVTPAPAPTPPPAPPVVAPTPPPAPPAPPLAATAPPSSIGSTIQRPSTGASNPASADFDLLAQIKAMRPPSAPIPSNPPISSFSPSPIQQVQGLHTGLGGSNSPGSMGHMLATQQTGGFGSPGLQPQQTGVRGPYAPVPANQGLLAPLVPTNTGFNSFIPTRPNLSAQPTGFAGGSPFGMGGQQTLQAQPTGMFSGFQAQQQPIQPQATGFQGIPQQPLQPQATGFQGGQFPYNGGNSMMNGGSNFGAAPSYGNSFGAGGLVPQQTGFQPQQPTGSSFDALARGPPQATPSNVNATAPANVFASMKAGNFASSPDSAPSADKYDVFRNPTNLAPQQTGWGGPGNFGSGIQPQQTGFQNGIQPQPTGFFPNGMYPQQPQQQGYGGYQ